MRLQVRDISVFKKLFWIFCLIISYAFIAPGAINAGFSLYFMATPFMAFAIFISRWKLKSNMLFYLSIVVIISSVLISYTQTKNPILFPIISGGYVEILKDGYHESFSDGSGGFVSDKEGTVCTGCGKVVLTKIKKGDRYKVLGVKITHPDFGQNVSVVTEIGEFSESDYSGTYGNRPNIKLNKPARAKWAERLSILP